MPAVLTFWQVPNDEDLLFEFLTTNNRVVAMSTHWARSRDELSPKSLAAYIRQYDPRQVFITLERFTPRVVIEPQMQNGEAFFSISDMKSCIIAYRRGSLRNGQLSQSNLSAYFEYPSEDRSVMIRKDSAFVNWAKEVLAWVRKATPERHHFNGHDYPTTKQASEAIEKGEVTVAL